MVPLSFVSSALHTSNGHDFDSGIMKSWFGLHHDPMLNGCVFLSSFSEVDGKLALHGWNGESRSGFTFSMNSHRCVWYMVYLLP